MRALVLIGTASVAYASSLCDKVVARNWEVSTRDCRRYCEELEEVFQDPLDVKQFTERCIYQHYEVVNGRTNVDHEDQCFEKWVHGYSEPVDLASIVPDLKTETPARCQEECQEHSQCVNWVWVSELATGSETEPKLCLLKSHEMVSRAAETLMTSSSTAEIPGFDTQFCNNAMPQQCLEGGFNCLKCVDDHPVCVWESAVHVSGWRHCGEQTQCHVYEQIPERHGGHCPSGYSNNGHGGCCHDSLAAMHGHGGGCWKPTTTTRRTTTKWTWPSWPSWPTRPTKPTRPTEPSTASTEILTTSTTTEATTITTEAVVTTAGGEETCGEGCPPPPCHCHDCPAHGCDSCCGKPGIMIRIADRPKLLKFELDN